VTAWSFGSVTFPFGPKQIAWVTTINKDVIPQSGTDPVSVVDGTSANSVQLSGSIADDSKTDSQLWSTYLAPMRALIGSSITVVSSNGSIDGIWLLEKFDPTRAGAALIYDYTMVLSKFSALVVL
jgi:phage protein U